MYFGEPNILTMDMMKEKNFSLKYDDYFKVEEVKQNMEGWVKLGKVVELKIGKALTISKMIQGQYKVIGGGYIPMKETHNEYNSEENDILISKDGAYAGFINRFNEKLFITSHCIKIMTRGSKYFRKTLFL
jgi:type I restriction enzyme S subunit